VSAAVTPESVEAVLRAAIIKAKAEGVRLAKGVCFADTENSGKTLCACAMGCVVLDHAGDRSGIFSAVLSRLGINMSQVNDISCGFDDVRSINASSAWTCVGVRLREEFNPGSRNTSEDLDHAW
jgi:hypothetical protein